MTRRTGDIAKSIELMLLRPRVMPGECAAFCEQAAAAHVAAVCVPPTHVETAVGVLRGGDVKVVALISHPFGADLPEIKARACRRAIEGGAQEVEIAVDLARFAGGDPNHVRDELRLCAAAARDADAEALVRGVIDTAAFDDRTLRLLARAVAAADVDMLVTSTGLAPEPDDVLDVELMREEVGAAIGVKAVRGARGLDEVAALLAAGASRVGTASAELLELRG
ncbi:MAG: deoxyribose-phosphate aldolase [Gaiellales bacterium]